MRHEIEKSGKGFQEGLSLQGAGSKGRTDGKKTLWMKEVRFRVLEEVKGTGEVHMKNGKGGAFPTGPTVAVGTCIS